MNEMTTDEKRMCRRELINWHLQNKGNNFRTPEFALRDLLFLVRNGEMYRYGQELRLYAQNIEN